MNFLRFKHASILKGAFKNEYEGSAVQGIRDMNTIRNLRGEPEYSMDE